jgi:hypothetical protein
MSLGYRTKLTRWLPAALAVLTVLIAWTASADTPAPSPVTPVPPYIGTVVHGSKVKKPDLPDMIISNVTYDYSADSKTILFHVTLKNIGTVGAEPYGIAADLPTGPQMVSYLGAILAPNKEVTINITLDNPRLAHTFRFYVDSTNLLKESNENNNRSADISVPGWLLGQKILQPDNSQFKLKDNSSPLKLLTKP